MSVISRCAPRRGLCAASGKLEMLCEFSTFCLRSVKLQTVVHFITGMSSGLFRKENASSAACLYCGLSENSYGYVSNESDGNDSVNTVLNWY